MLLGDFYHYVNLQIVLTQTKMATKSLGDMILWDHTGSITIVVHNCP
jgi:hypothetical protein